MWSVLFWRRVASVMVPRYSIRSSNQMGSTRRYRDTPICIVDNAVRGRYKVDSESRSTFGSFFMASTISAGMLRRAACASADSLLANSLSSSLISSDMMGSCEYSGTGRMLQSP